MVAQLESLPEGRGKVGVCLLHLNLVDLSQVGHGISGLVHLSSSTRRRLPELRHVDVDVSPHRASCCCSSAPIHTTPSPSFRSFTVVEALVVIILERTLASLTASASSAATIVAATGNMIAEAILLETHKRYTSDKGTNEQRSGNAQAHSKADDHAVVAVALLRKEVALLSQRREDVFLVRLFLDVRLDVFLRAGVAGEKSHAKGEYRIARRQSALGQGFGRQIWHMHRYLLSSSPAEVHPRAHFLAGPHGRGNDEGHVEGDPHPPIGLRQVIALVLAEKKSAQVLLDRQLNAQQTLFLGETTPATYSAGLGAAAGIHYLARGGHLHRHLHLRPGGEEGSGGA
jgi:hypothetical protein